MKARGPAISPGYQTCRHWLTLALALLALPSAWGYYDPGSQRWINRDPVGERGGFNLYLAFGNSPSEHIDPGGHSPIRPVLPVVPILQIIVRGGFAGLEDCAAKLSAAKAQALSYFVQASTNYTCCVNGKTVGLEKFPGALTGIQACQYGVLHCLAGYFARQQGASSKCLALGNIGNELLEFYELKEWQSGKNGKNGKIGWLRDTYTDMLEVRVGYDLWGAEGCVPAECAKK